MKIITNDLNVIKIINNWFNKRNSNEDISGICKVTTIMEFKEVLKKANFNENYTYKLESKDSRTIICIEEEENEIINIDLSFDNSTNMNNIMILTYADYYQQVYSYNSKTGELYETERRLLIDTEYEELDYSDESIDTTEYSIPLELTQKMYDEFEKYNVKFDKYDLLRYWNEYKNIYFEDTGLGTKKIIDAIFNDYNNVPSFQKKLKPKK